MASDEKKEAQHYTDSRLGGIGCASIILALALAYVLVQWVGAGFPGLR